MDEDSIIIMGFDILPSSSPRSKTAPKFACVIVKNGTVLNEYPELSRRALLKLIREVRPRLLATDNIFEIVPDSKAIFKFASKIPLETRLAQVTGVPPHQVALKILARRHGLGVRGKPSPLESAKLAALLAEKGVGHSLECFGAQTEIKVTRGRKLGRGGQSVNRYRRKMHSQIQQMTRHIESQLKGAGIDYDIDIRTSDYGYASSRIIAYEPVPAVKGLVESKRGGDFNVNIAPVRKRVEFLPLEPKPIPSQYRPKFYILGIDPGTTAAICLLSFNGKVSMLRSKKGLTRADIIRMVYEKGIPVMVASDVPNAPHLIEKIASTVNAEVYTPRKPIPVATKQELAREFSEEIKIHNAHERDALTAAVYAYRSILPKLQQIDKKIREEQIPVDRNHLKALVIKGTPINEAIASLTEETSEPVEVIQEPVEKEPVTQERFDALKKKYSDLEDELQSQIVRTEDLERLVQFLRFRESELEHSIEIMNRENYWRVKRDREVAKKKSELRHAHNETEFLQERIHELEERLDLLRGVKRLEIRGDTIAVKTVEKFTQESIEDYMKRIAHIKNGDIILFEDASGGGPQTASLLIDREIRAVIVCTPLSHLAQEELVKAMIPVISADDVELRRIDEFAFIDRKKFDAQIQAFLKEVQELARQRGEEQLIEIVERYRREIER